MNRRHFSARLLFAWLASAALPLRAQTALLTPTQQDAEGPYYPEGWSGDVDNNLTTLDGTTSSHGAAMEIVGTVRSVQGAAIPGAMVEIWQADHTGQYRHSRDGGEGPATRGFQGFGRMQADGEGAYRFRTIKPPPYENRPAHVHFRVIAPGYTTLTTQMYFANENSEGGFLSLLRMFVFARERDLLTVEPTTHQDNGIALLRAQFDVVLAPQKG
jgi:protocatechuate 3,4-dioxygenase, beta subunit